MSIQSEINSVVRVLEEIQHRRARITDSLDECRFRAQRVGGALPADVVVDLVNSIAGGARRIQELATNGLITIADA